MGRRDARVGVRAGRHLPALKALVLSRSRLRERSLVERFDYYKKLCRGRLSLDYAHVKKGPLTERVPTGWRTIALDERGRALTSRELAQLIGELLHSGVTGVAFLVGDADGFQPGERESADELWSLSNLTLPHQLCFVVLAEQLYRATTILRGEKYHRD